MKTKTRKLSKTFNILAVASIAAILLGSITFFSEQAYSSDAGGNLVVHYDFEDAANPTSDVSGHGNDGTLFGGAGFSGDVPPILGNTKSLDLTTTGLLDYLIKNPVEAAPTPFPSTAITTALWVKSSDNADFPIFVSYATNAAGTSFNDWGIQNVSPEFQGYVNNGVLRTTTGPTVLDNAWHHVAASWQSSDGQMKLYFDGVLIKTVLGVKTGESIAGAGSLVLGQEQDSVGAGFHANDDFNGLLDDVRIYDRVLTDTEIEALSLGLPIDNPKCDGEFANIYKKTANDDTSSNTFFVDGVEVEMERYDEDGINGIEADEGWIITGTGNKRDRLADVVVGSDLHDLITPGWGDDTVCAGDGDDTVQGGWGMDTLFGEAGDDLLKGGHNDDTLIGGDNTDEAQGGQGSGDTCEAETTSKCETIL